MTEEFKQQSLQYHRQPTPGKISVTPTKTLANQFDLSLAYSPGVAHACDAIVDDPGQAASLTARGNLVAVISNGTAVLGLGPIGPLASKPVMEGKAVLFKKFAGIDVFDIEIDERDPEMLVEVIARLEPTFGGINLEDIRAPECFEVERRLRERMNIPVFHDDQHGTAIIAAAAVLNGLRLVGKKIEEVRVVGSGAGAAGLACLDQLVSLGVRRENITVCDRLGVVYKGRVEEMDPRKEGYAQDTPLRTLAEVISGADIFLGLSAPGVLKPEMVECMAPDPLILALANPVPEIMPDLARSVRPDAIVATGRSDFPNQVNNVLCFPYLFRGALDVGATTINEEMKMAVVRALADMTMKQASENVASAYSGDQLSFGPEYLIPKPFDTRLILELPVAVARAAMKSGVATRPIEDFHLYRESLSSIVYRTGSAMRPLFERAAADPRRVIYTEGENERVLRAVQVVIDEGLAKPILIGRKDRILGAIERLNLGMSEADFQLIDPRENPHYEECWQTYHQLRRRHGIDPIVARIRVNTEYTVLGALLLRLGYADAMVCGTFGRFEGHLKLATDVLGKEKGVKTVAAMNMLITSKGTVFIADTNVTLDPDADQIVDITLQAADALRKLGIVPKVALLSHTNFGARRDPASEKMAKALRRIRKQAPELEVEGEMKGDTALLESLRERVFPGSRLKGGANLLIMPNLDAANIASALIKVLAAEGVAVGPIMLGLRWPTHILTRSSTMRRIINMTAVAVVDAQLSSRAQRQESGKEA
ncbi:MAG: NADP-dependent malic enzyme [Gammaproteobacteria bacterium]|nr:NADP-dependent malic enzyme [Gammaproteobacteria bacterium]